MLLEDFGVRVLACTPSYALTLAEALAARGIDAVNIYGLSEVIGPGVSIECVDAKAGSHIFEDAPARACRRTGADHADELSPHYQLVVRRPRTLDELEVKIEMSEPFAREAGPIDAGNLRVGVLAGRCAEVLRSALGLSAQVTLTGPRSLPRSDGGKLRRVRDERTLT